MLQVYLVPARHALRNSPNHQIRRIRPWLRGVDDNAPEIDTGFFPDFAAYGFFDGFGGLDEAGQRGVPEGGPAFLAAEEDAGGRVVDDGHDDGGVGAGK